jgi:predicted dehydrogenase
MRRLRAGVIGLGVGEQHIAAFQDHPRCEVVALCDRAADKRERAAAQHPGVRVTADADELLDDPGIDVVAVASYDDAHAAQVVRGLEAGKHLFVEKPLCQTLGQLRGIKQAWARHQGKLKLASNLVLRAAPLYRWLKDRLAEGALGEPYAFDGEYLYGRLPKITEGWRKDVVNYSVMAGGGVHLIDLLVWLTGQRPATVTAAGNRICTRGSAFRYPDFVTATFVCTSGLVARVSANFGCVHRHQHVIRLFGTRGTFLYDDAGPRCHTSRDPAVPACPLTLPALPSSKGDLIGPFVDAILADQDLGAETQSHFDTLSLCLACDAALESGSPQEVVYV